MAKIDSLVFYLLPARVCFSVVSAQIPIEH